jgi:Ca2+-binding RTX toxin-like protein
MSTQATGVENLVLIGNTIGSAVNAVGNALNNVMMGNSIDNVLQGGLRNDTLIGAGGDDTLQGDDGNDFLDGGAGQDTLQGGGGNDGLNGGIGNDTLNGGGGNDTYIVDNRDDVVIEAVGGGKDLILTKGDYFLGAGQEIEAITLTGIQGADLFGNEFANIITGGRAGRPSFFTLTREIARRFRVGLAALFFV